MSTAIHVLAIDDNDLLLDELRRLFEAEGYAFTGVMRRDEAREALARQDWRLIVIDQKLDGSAGPDRGLELIDHARIQAPDARIIVMSGHATAESVRRAFSAGADDFIEKSGSGTVFYDILIHKARQSIDAARDRRMLALQADAREHAMAEHWQAALTETDRNRKGRLLEETLKLLFETLPGLSHVRSNPSNDLEEIDLLVRNKSADPFWAKQSSYLLVECKNWSGKVGVPEVQRLFTKMEQRYGQCRLGLLIAVGGFATTVPAEVLSRRRGDALVILLDRSDVDRLIRAPADERLERLERLHDRAIVEVNGTH